MFAACIIPFMEVEINNAVLQSCFIFLHLSCSVSCTHCLEMIFIKKVIMWFYTPFTDIWTNFTLLVAYIWFIMSCWKSFELIVILYPIVIWKKILWGKLWSCFTLILLILELIILYQLNASFCHTGNIYMRKVIKQFYTHFKLIILY